MIRFDPPVSMKPLTDVESGSLVRWGDQGQHAGFCVISTGDPQQRKSFVTYDPEAHRFNWEYADSPTVVSYGNEVIVRPDVASFAPELTVQADGTLYTLEGSPHLVVAMGNSVRFLDLSTGELKSRQSWPMMGGYRSWIAGVLRRDSGLVEVLSVTPRREVHPDDGPTEPEEV
jgi:hypothetical protein